MKILGWFYGDPQSVARVVSKQCWIKRKVEQWEVLWYALIMHNASEMGYCQCDWVFCQHEVNICPDFNGHNNRISCLFLIAYFPWNSGTAHSGSSNNCGRSGRDRCLIGTIDQPLYLSRITKGLTAKAPRGAKWEWSLNWVTDSSKKQCVCWFYLCVICNVVFLGS